MTDIAGLGTIIESLTKTRAFWDGNTEVRWGSLGGSSGAKWLSLGAWTSPNLWSSSIKTACWQADSSGWAQKGRTSSELTPPLFTVYSCSEIRCSPLMQDWGVPTGDWCGGARAVYTETDFTATLFCDTAANKGMRHSGALDNIPLRPQRELFAEVSREQTQQEHCVRCSVLLWSKGVTNLREPRAEHQQWYRSWKPWLMKKEWNYLVCGYVNAH